MENRIVSILINLDGDIIVTYADGTTQNLGPADGLDPESILAQCQAAQAAAAEAAAAAVAAVESIPADYSQLASDVEDLKADVSGIETTLESKADADDLDALESDITDLSETKADKDGVYDYLTAGLAKQLATDQGIADSVPYLMRPSGGGVAVGTYEQDKIVGGSIVWNQLIQNGDFSDDFTGWTKSPYGNASVSNGVCTFSLTDTSNGTHGIFQDLNLINGHKYFCTATIKNLMSTSGTFAVKYFTSAYVNGASAIIASGETKQVSGVFMPTADSTKIVVGISTNLTAMDVFEVSNIMLIDLTAMFGPTIADYIHSLEQATAGAGVAWLKQHFPKQFDSGYQDYNAGEIKSVGGLVSHEMTGFNQWDEEWESGAISSSTGQNTSSSGTFRSTNYIPILPNTAYYAVGAFLNVRYYDANKLFIGTSTASGSGAQFTTPSNAHYMRFYCTGEAYANNICINLSNPAKNGTYEPYEVHSYPLDTDLVLRGIPKITDGKLSYDGDVYSPEGTVERRFAERAYQSGDESLTDALTDGTVTVYKLTTPATETAAPYQTPQLVDPDGTEEYVLTDGAFPLPVGHETFYPADLKEKLEGLPWNFSDIIAPTESEYTAGRPYTSGDLFIVNNILYKAVASIASGATITPGTNCTATSVAAEIKALQ